MNIFTCAVSLVNIVTMLSGLILIIIVRKCAYWSVDGSVIRIIIQ